MPATHSTIVHPWQTAYTIWGSSALLNSIVYMPVLAIFGGNAGVEFSLLMGLISAMISLPTIILLRWLLPLSLKSELRSQRIIKVAGLVVLIFLLLATPFGMAFSMGSDDAGAPEMRWADVGAILFFSSPCLVGALVATGYTCRALLFRPDTFNNDDIA